MDQYPPYRVDEIDNVARVLRARVQDLKPIDDNSTISMVLRLGNTANLRSKQVSLTYAAECLRSGIFETLLDLILVTPPRKNSIQYYQCVHTVESIFTAAAGREFAEIMHSANNPTKVLQQITKVLVQRWPLITEKLWRYRHLKILPFPDVHQISFGSLVMRASPTMNNDELTEDTDDHALRLIAYYWAHAGNESARHRMQMRIGNLITHNQSSNPLSTRISLLGYLWGELGNTPGLQLLRLLTKAAPGPPFLITTGWMITAFSDGVDTTHRAKQLDCLQALVSSEPFWKQYTTGITDEIRSHPIHQAKGNLRAFINILCMSVHTPQLREPLLLNLAHTSFVDYLESIVVKDGDPRDRENFFICLGYLKRSLELASTEARDAMSRQFPRMRMFHLLSRQYLMDATKATQDNYNELLSWIPLLQLQKLLLRPQRCTYRGCCEQAIKCCLVCKSKYCSVDCQKRDWQEHKLVCRMMPKIQEMEAFKHIGQIIQLRSDHRV